MKLRHDKHTRAVVMGLLALSMTAISTAARAGGDPWEPRGLEAVWSAGHRSHPEFMNVRRKEYETQKGAALSTGNINEIVNLYDQGRRDRTPAEILVTGYQK